MDEFKIGIFKFARISPYSILTSIVYILIVVNVIAFLLILSQLFSSNQTPTKKVEETLLVVPVNETPVIESNDATTVSDPPVIEPNDTTVPPVSDPPVIDASITVEIAAKSSIDDDNITSTFIDSEQSTTDVEPDTNESDVAPATPIKTVTKKADVVEGLFMSPDGLRSRRLLNKKKN